MSHSHTNSRFNFGSDSDSSEPEKPSDSPKDLGNQVFSSSEEVIDATVVDTDPSESLSDSDTEISDKTNSEEKERSDCLKYLTKMSWFVLEMDSNKPRKVTWPLIFAQLFRPTEARSVLLWAGLILFSFILPILFDKLSSCWTSPSLQDSEFKILLVFFILAYFLTYYFLKGFRVIQLLKRGNASMGHFFQILEVKNIFGQTRHRLRYAYKANDDMIYTISLDADNYQTYASVPALTIFYFPDKPDEGMIYEEMFGLISFNSPSRTFTQNRWYWLTLGLPVLPFLTFAVGMILIRCLA